jgi:glycerophosphoryl diester phosphodiesterase
MPHLARENTLPSFSAALSAGADGIELDVHATADDVVVVHHDPMLAGGAEIRTTPYAKLLDLIGGSELLPTLDDVCALVRGSAELFIEIKGDHIEQLVLHSLRGYSGRHAIHSFDHALIARIARCDEHPRLGVLLEDSTPGATELMQRVGALDLWPQYTLATPLLIEEVHAIGGRVIVWTVNSADSAHRLALIGADGICTDDVSRLRDV